MLTTDIQFTMYTDVHSALLHCIQLTIRRNRLELCYSGQKKNRVTVFSLFSVQIANAISQYNAQSRTMVYENKTD